MGRRRRRQDTFTPVDRHHLDGFYTPDCEPIKLVNGCIGEFTPEGAIRWECPLFLPEQPELLRKFPRAGQYLLGGPKVLPLTLAEGFADRLDDGHR